jgi:hypothetical protein
MVDTSTFEVQKRPPSTTEAHRGRDKFDQCVELSPSLFCITIPCVLSVENPLGDEKACCRWPNVEEKSYAISSSKIIFSCYFR